MRQQATRPPSADVATRLDPGASVLRGGLRRNLPMSGFKSAHRAVHFVAQNTPAGAEHDGELLRLNMRNNKKLNERQISRDRHWHRAKPVQGDRASQIDEARGRRAKKMNQIRFGRLPDSNLVNLALGNRTPVRRPGCQARGNQDRSDKNFRFMFSQPPHSALNCRGMQQNHFSPSNFHPPPKATRSLMAKAFAMSRHFCDLRASRSRNEFARRHQPTRGSQPLR